MSTGHVHNVTSSACSLPCALQAKPGPALLDKLAQYNSGLPTKESVALPPSWYIDEDVYGLERRSVFTDNWIAVGREDEASAPNSFFKLGIGEEPVLIVRDGTGTLRALSNVCRHRATQLVDDNQGSFDEGQIQCPYHGWKYELTGRLCKAPGLGPVANFSRDTHSLPEYETAIWGPLLFTRMHGNPNEFAQEFPELIDMTASKPLSTFKWGGRKEYELNCNWKVFIDNYLDGGYHVSIAHPTLSSALDGSKYKCEMFERSSVQTCPVKDGDDSAKSTRSGSDAMYWWLYPNTMINIYNDAMDTNIVLPMGKDRCKVIFDFFFADNWNDQTIRDYIDTAHQTQLEDVELSERVQSGLRSMHYTPGPYAKSETIQHHFHRLLASDLSKAVQGS